MKATWTRKKLHVFSIYVSSSHFYRLCYLLCIHGGLIFGSKPTWRTTGTLLVQSSAFTPILKIQCSVNTTPQNPLFSCKHLAPFLSYSNTSRAALRIESGAQTLVQSIPEDLHRWWGEEGRGSDSK